MKAISLCSKMLSLPHDVADQVLQARIRAPALLLHIRLLIRCPVKTELLHRRDSLMQELQIKLEAVTALNLKLTDAQKKCQSLEAQLLPLKEAQAVSCS